jgi:hypothetical protein
MLIFVGLKISGEIPVKLGKSDISLKIRGVFPFIWSKTLDFVLLLGDNGNISPYNCFKSFLFKISGKFSPYEFSYSV